MILVHHVYQIALSTIMKVNKKNKLFPFFSVQPILDFENLITTGNGYFTKNPVVSLLFSEIISGSSGGCHVCCLCVSLPG